MGRAPNPGAPQRVSAHVLPKAQAFSADDEEEKTTIESGGWEEEASTTVEQGEVADKVRALALAVDPHRPSTGSSVTTANGEPDESTVDEPRNAAPSALPPPSVARLVITQGNDIGQAIEVTPGKIYTVGRGLDNDLVLTDIAVSRKHFELRCENDRWVLADRGSGNGTLINSRIEDAPFTLATGDAIEIGNTAFRFEHPNGAAQIPPRFGGRGDDYLEPSTVSGEPLETDGGTPPQLAPVSRPKTLPPPAPVPRTRPPSNRPVEGYAAQRPSAPSMLEPVPTSAPNAPTISPAQSVPAIHLPGVSPAAPPLSSLKRSPQQPTLFDRQGEYPLPASEAGRAPPSRIASLVDPLVPSLVPPPGPIPTTLPGPGTPAHPARLPFSYPTGELTKQPLPAGVRRSMPVAAVVHPRDGSSTALVRPTGYSSNGQPVIVPQQTYRPPPALSYRMKMALAATGLALFMAIATIAILKGATGDPATTAGDAVEPPPTTTSSTPLTPPPPLQGRTITPIVTPDPTTPPPRPTTIPPLPTTTPPLPTTAPTPIPATTAPPPTTTAPPRPEVAVPRMERPASVAKRADRRPDKPDRAADKRIATAKPEKPETASAESPSKKHGRAILEVKRDADALYRKKDFNGAASALSSALPSFSGTDAQQLKSVAASYVLFGKAYNVGMAPATKTTDAFVSLRQALVLDKDLGAGYTSEIQERLIAIASRAAVSYMAAREYESAYLAVRTSDSLGSQSPSIKSVREKLLQVATDLYRTALNDLTTDPDGAKRKLHQIQGMVDAKTPIYANATKLLSGS